MHAFRVLPILTKNFNVQCKYRVLSVALANKWSLRRSMSSTGAEPLLKVPSSSNEQKEFSPKLHHIVDEISKLSLLEVSELNQLLKLSLNIPDTPMMQMTAMPAAGRKAEEEETDTPVAAKTDYTVKLLKFEDSKKVGLIKEVKTLVEGMNLVQAKKFVESVPQVIKSNLTKEEAEKLKKTLEDLGGTCSME